MKRIIKAVVLLVILLIVGVLAALFFIDHIARNAVERGATYALGVETALGSAEVRILRGEFDMGRLRVANPEGFTSPHFMTLGDGGVAVTLGSLRRETVVLPTLHLTDIDMHLEKRAGQTNYNAILENLRRLSTGEKPAEDAPGQKKFVVNEIVMRNIDVHVDVLPIGGQLTRVKLNIPEITLRDVGSDTEKGVVMSELSGVIMRALFAAIVQKGGDLIPAEMLGDLTGALTAFGGDLGKFGIELSGEAIGTLGGILQGVGGIGEGVGREAERRLRDVGKGLGGILGGDRKKDDDDD